MLALNRAPFPVSYRELWLPETIRSTQLPPFRGNARLLTLTGAQKRTTADGVRFTGAATSNIVVAAAAGQNAQQAFHITIRFKLTSAFAAGAAANQYLFQKALDANNYIRVYLRAVDGMLVWQQGDGIGGIQFTLTSTTVSWAADTWYIVTCSLTNTPTQRLLVNGVLEDSDIAAAVATPNGGDMVIGSSSDGGTDGIIGVISWVVIGVGTTAATALTAAEETSLNSGSPPATAKVQYLFLMDEGSGTTVYDRGSAGGNGTLDSAITWEFGQVRAPVISLDGVNDYADSGANNTNIQLPCTFAIVCREKCLSASRVDVSLRFDNDNIYYIRYYSATQREVRYTVAGTPQDIQYSWSFTIGGYIIVLVSISLAGMFIYHQGYQIATRAITLNQVNLVRTRLGSLEGTTQYSGNAILYAALVEGAFTRNQALLYSRWLRDIFNLPISI